MFQKYKQVFKLGFYKTMQYRTNFFISLIGVGFVLLMQIFMWKGLYAASDGGNLFGYKHADMLLYAIFAGILSKVITASFAFEVNEDIKNGGLAKYIVRPVSYRVYQFFSYMGEKASVIVFSILIFIGVYIIGNYAAGNQIFMTRFFLFLLVLFNAFILNFSIYYAVGGLGFWMRESSGVIYITALVGNIVSGGIFPLDIFPLGVQAFLKCLPFSYTNYFSVSVLLGRTAGIQIAYGIMMQILWIAVCFAISKIVWWLGLKKYVAVGS